MKDQPLVSAIIIFFNEEKFLAEAIDSVCAQTYGHWELLLVDDGSTDRSSDIARRYAAAQPDKVRCLEHAGHRNLGASAARNLGISQARGEYLAFLDGDDVWLPNKLEEQVAILESQPQAAMLYGATQWWFSWSGKPADGESDYICELGVEPNRLFLPPALLTRYLRLDAITPCTCSILVRREALQSIGGFEEEFRRLYTDQVFYAKICSRAPVYVAAECWDRYRQHPDSSCAVYDRTGQQRFERQRYLKWLERYLRAASVRDAELWQALENSKRQFCEPPLQYWWGRARHSNLARAVASRLRPWLR